MVIVARHTPVAGVGADSMAIGSAHSGGEAVSRTRLCLDDDASGAPTTTEPPEARPLAERACASTTTPVGPRRLRRRPTQRASTQPVAAFRTQRGRAYSATRANTLTGIPVMLPGFPEPRLFTGRADLGVALTAQAVSAHRGYFAPLLLCGREPRGRHRTLEEGADLQSVARPPWSPFAPRCERGGFSRPGGKVRSLPSALSVSGTVVGERRERYIYIYLCT